MKFDYISKKEYLKQLKIQRYYLFKFSLNYASGWLKVDIERFINSIDSEISLIESIMKKNSKNQQVSFDLGGL